MNLIDRDKLLDDLVNRLPKMATITEATLPVLICEQPVIKAVPVARKQVEKVWGIGAWEMVADEGFVDTMGRQVSHLHCPVCDFFWRETGHKKYFKFCPACGVPMTDEAVDILWKRLEAMQE